MLLWLFGDVVENRVFSHSNTKSSGQLQLAGANINWELSIEDKDLPQQAKEKGGRSFRSLIIEDEEIDFSEGWKDCTLLPIEKFYPAGALSLQKLSKRSSWCMISGMPKHNGV